MVHQGRNATTLRINIVGDFGRASGQPTARRPGDAMNHVFCESSGPWAECFLTHHFQLLLPTSAGIKTQQSRDMVAAADVEQHASQPVCSWGCSIRTCHQPPGAPFELCMDTVWPLVSSLDRSPESQTFRPGGKRGRAAAHVELAAGYRQRSQTNRTGVDSGIA
ncbi:hypothetical protein PCL_03516 [Purpureocillium lilacinum]|uniref:Uncharacterized protein n=1 Tax=Purpureocillium lilacinum TaxID=33203 RepID=A0A2U3EPA6_PURLI|nr:hypothetical protein Purlil1_2491 [Purpureocillium lilacinum]PWI76322.1 hypothetical protein PCL_03516 [Purpureocillium lilacinum]